jgi:hypothetical protein
MLHLLAVLCFECVLLFGSDLLLCSFLAHQMRAVAVLWAVACAALVLSVAVCCASPHPFAARPLSSSINAYAEEEEEEESLTAADYPSLPLPANMLFVPLYLQQTNYSCGPASVLSLLWYWKWNQFQNTTEQQLYTPLDTSVVYGTNPQPMADFLVQVCVPL